MPIAARRTFRIAFTTALCLAVAYGLALPLPYLAPIFAVVLSSLPAPPVGLKGLVGLVVLILVTLGIGLLLIPAFTHYPVTAVLVVGLGLHLSTYLAAGLGKQLVGTFLTIGFTIIPAAGTFSFELAVAVIVAMAAGIGLAIVSLWVVYPFFPEDPPGPRAAPAERPHDGARWMALRVTLIVLPPFLLALMNPSMYLKLIMKTVMLGQQASIVDARSAGVELLGSTFLGGVGAILFWLVLKMQPDLWMFFLWTLLFFIFFAGKLTRSLATRFPPSFWQNVAITMLILIGSAVQDSANGDDPYSAFAVRMGMFLAVTLYAWVAIEVLEGLRARHLRRRGRLVPATGRM